MIYSNIYSNKSWCIVGQNFNTLKEIKQLEHNMCLYLEWILHVKAGGSVLLIFVVLTKYSHFDSAIAFTSFNYVLFTVSVSYP